MNIDLNLDLNCRYLVGASGGSDSMTLLSLCVEQGYSVVVAHVNYKLRANADKEEALLKDYCQQHGVDVFTLYPQQEVKENFQKWARDVRYQFYKEIYDQFNCEALLLGHQMDDHIENYLMSLQRNSHGWVYGIQKENHVFGMKVIRPLLEMRKRETRQYCLENHVPFGDDESNFSDKYSRNRVRHQLVEPAGDQQIQQWLCEIDLKNQQLKEKVEYIEKKYDWKQEILLESFTKESKEIQEILVRWYMDKSNVEDLLSSDFIEEICRVLNQSAKNGEISINKTQVLVHEYGCFYICEKRKDFSYQLNDIQTLKTPFFSLGFEGKVIESVNLSQSDFPIIIRNAKAEDSIELRFGHKKVNRFFIDRKIAYKKRIQWPVIENAQGKVIFVKDIGCDINHFSTNANLFMIE